MLTKSFKYELHVLYRSKVCNFYNKVCKNTHLIQNNSLIYTLDLISFCLTYGLRFT